MRTFYELCEGRVWKAVEAMIVGLETQSKRPDFRVNMQNFGYVSYNGFCCGCAATCAIQQVAGINFTKHTIEDKNTRAAVIKVDCTDMYQFENAINALRLGMLGSIFDYFRKDRRLVEFRNLPELRTCDWSENLNTYRELLTELKERDI